MDGLKLPAARILLAFVYFGTQFGEISGQSCESGNDHYCLVYHDTPETRSDAEATCNGEGGHLVSIYDASYQGLVEQLMARHDSNGTWTSGRLDANAYDVNQHWRWVSNCEYCGIDLSEYLDASIYAQGCYKEWFGIPEFDHQVGEDQIDNMTRALCITLCRDADYTYAANREGDQCWCGEEFGWYGTTTGCSIPCSGDTSQWCGGLGRNSVYYTRDGLFGEWAYERPHDEQGLSYCAAVFSGNDYRFADEECRKTYAFVCELPMDYCDGSITPPQNGDSVVISDTCVFLSDSEQTWFHAQESCRLMDGHLVTLPNSAFLNALAGELADERPNQDFTWIGLAKKIWFWEYGPDMGYTNFPASEPANPNYECMFVDWDYDWVTIDCSSSTSMSFICAIEITTTEATQETTVETTAATSTIPETTEPEITTETATSAETASPTTTSAETTTLAEATTTETTTLTATTPSQSATTLTDNTLETTTEETNPETTTTTLTDATQKTSTETTTEGKHETGSISSTDDGRNTRTTTSPTATSDSTRTSTRGTGSGASTTTLTPTKSSTRATPGTSTEEVQGPGTAGQSTTDDDGLSVAEIVIIALCIFLLLLIILLVILFICYKKKNKYGTVSPAENKYDARPKAHIPETGPIGQPEGDLPYSESGSTAMLISDPKAFGSVASIPPASSRSGNTATAPHNNNGEVITIA